MKYLQTEQEEEEIALQIIKPQQTWTTTFPLKPFTGIVSEGRPFFASVPPKVLKTNASFLLKNDFDYISGDVSSNCLVEGNCTTDLMPKNKTLKKGTKVTGSLIRNYYMSSQLGSNGLEIEKLSDLEFMKKFGLSVSEYEMIYSQSRNYSKRFINYSDVLELKNMGFNGNPLIIPIELLEEDKVKKSDSLIAKKTDNTNVLIVVGVLLVGYALFSSNDSN